MKVENKVELEQAFNAQKNIRWDIAKTSAKQRIEKLKKLKIAITERQNELCEATWKDYHKPAFETWLTEIFPVMEEINEAIKHLKKWTKDKKVPGVFFMPFSSSYLRYEPKGHVLIMAPWNYPFQLLIAPLVSAIAAGNVCFVKPSNKTPHTSAFMASLLEELFLPEEVFVVEGAGSVVGDLLLEMPFDHVFFTGSPAIGARVAEITAKNHSAVTLELGGKSPCIILPETNLADAAKKITWGTFLNSGQTCVEPDYIFCPQDKVEAFANLVCENVKSMYGQTAEERRQSKDFVHIVDVKACQNHKNMVEDALAKGAKSVLEGEFDVDNRFTPPTVLVDVTEDMEVMKQEIFGPIMPIFAYSSIKDVINFIQARPKPLALYVFGKSRKQTSEILNRTTSGSACVNNVIIQIENLHVPFGGVGMSGTGSYHGFFGFKTFSHERNYLKQSALNIIAFFYPPYGKKLQAFLQDAMAVLGNFYKKNKGNKNDF